MITRRNLFAAVAGGTLANFTLVAAPKPSMGKNGVDACVPGHDACSEGGANVNKGDSCGNSGGKGQDRCSARVNDAVCSNDTCRAKASDVE